MIFLPITTTSWALPHIQENYQNDFYSYSLGTHSQPLGTQDISLQNLIVSLGYGKINYFGLNHLSVDFLLGPYNKFEKYDQTFVDYNGYGMSFSQFMDHPIKNMNSFFGFGVKVKYSFLQGIGLIPADQELKQPSVERLAEYTNDITTITMAPMVYFSNLSSSRLKTSHPDDLKTRFEGLIFSSEVHVPIYTEYKKRFTHLTALKDAKVAPFEPESLEEEDEKETPPTLQSKKSTLTGSTWGINIIFSLTFLIGP
jgi:hypothetical protein